MAKFELWVRPVAALAMFENTNFYNAATAISEGLVDGSIGAAAETLTFDGATVHRSSIPAGLWRGWNSQDDTRFWATGDFSRLVATAPGNRPIEAFGVRFEPISIDTLLSKQGSRSVAQRSGRLSGRRAGRSGEPIARVVRRLLALPSLELASCKVEALAAELMDEYRALGLSPPHLDNAKRDAAGILRALREDCGT